MAPSRGFGSLGLTPSLLIILTLAHLNAANGGQCGLSKAKTVEKEVEQVVLVGQEGFEETMNATAYSCERKERVIYHEEHVIKYNHLGEVQEQTTKYFSPDGNRAQIAEMRSDFSLNRNMPVYEFKQPEHQWLEGVITQETGQGAEYLAFRQEFGKLETKPLPRDKPGLYTGQGWHYHLLDRLEEIANAKISQIHMDLVFPAQLTSHPFVLKKEWQEGDHLRLSLSFNNWLISFFAPKLVLTYDHRRKKIVDFTGLSNIYDKDGKLQNVHIVYT